VKIKIQILTVLALAFILSAHVAVGLPVNSINQLLDGLKSDDPKMVDKTIKDLGIEQGISGGFSKYEILRPWINKNDRYILILSWDPPAGYLLLLDQHGRVLSKVKSGRIKSACLREIDNKHEDILVIESNVGFGSGYGKDTYQIYAVRQDNLTKLWEDIAHLDDVYMQNKIIDGNIAFVPSSDHAADNLIYSFTEKKFMYDKQKKDWVEESKETFKKIYRFENDKFVSIEPLR
jgi:hypothetical protein